MIYDWLSSIDISQMVVVFAYFANLLWTRLPDMSSFGIGL